MEFKGNRIKDFQCEEGLHDLEVMFVLQGLELAKTQDGDDGFALQKELYLNSLKTKNIPGVQDIHSWADAKRVLTQHVKRLNGKTEATETKFSFEVQCLSWHEFIQDIKNRNLNMGDYIITMNEMTFVKISTNWSNNTPDFQMTNLNLKYVPINPGTTSTPEGFVLTPISNPFIVSVTNEIKSCLSFLDAEQKNPDWEITVQNLKQYARMHLYCETMIKTCLLNFVRLYQPTEMEFYMDLPANDIAQRLLESAKKVDKKLVKMTSLYNLERTVGQPLSDIMSKAKLYIDCIFPETNQEKLREKQMLTGLISFVSDDIAIGLKQEIANRQKLGQPVNYNRLLMMAMKLELRENCYPPVNLKFGRSVGNNAATLMNLRAFTLEEEEEEEDDVRRQYLQTKFGRRGRTGSQQPVQMAPLLSGATMTVPPPPTSSVSIAQAARGGIINGVYTPGVRPLHLPPILLNGQHRESPMEKMARQFDDMSESPKIGMETMIIPTTALNRYICFNLIDESGNYLPITEYTGYVFLHDNYYKFRTKDFSVSDQMILFRQVHKDELETAAIQILTTGHRALKPSNEIEFLTARTQATTVKWEEVSQLQTLTPNIGAKLTRDLPHENGQTPNTRATLEEQFKERERLGRQMALLELSGSRTSTPKTRTQSRESTPMQFNYSSYQERNRSPYRRNEYGNNERNNSGIRSNRYFDNERSVTPERVQKRDDRYQSTYRDGAGEYRQKSLDRDRGRNDRYQSKDRDGKQESRNRSGTREQRGEDRDRKWRPSEGEYRSYQNSPNRNRDQYRREQNGQYRSSQRRNESPSPYRYSDRRETDKRSRSASWERTGRQNWDHNSRTRNESKSDAYRGRSSSRNASPWNRNTRSRDQERNRGRSPGTWNRNESRDRGNRYNGSYTRNGSSKSYSPDKKSEEYRYRNVSSDTSDMLKKMKKGVNCSATFSLRNPNCTKCRKPGHYEFLCSTYEMYNPNNCRICNAGNHFERNCAERHSIPTPILNNSTAEEKLNLANRIRALLEEGKN